jgi:protein-tyrosine phosphatase
MSIRILFVCLGNICRSPIAEGTFRALVEQRKLSSKISCDSAGTHNYHIGDLPDHRTRKNAESHGITLTHHCRRLTGSDFAKFDYVVAMDESNLENIQAISYRATGIYQPDEVCFLLRQFDPIESNEASVPDPYYGDESDFENVFQIVNRCNERFLDWLVEKHGVQTSWKSP